jgi:hypothetical protein
MDRIPRQTDIICRLPGDESERLTQNLDKIFKVIWEHEDDMVILVRILNFKIEEEAKEWLIR